MPRFRTVHPFPARMAPAIAWNALRTSKGKLTVLDPMAGSGTTLVAAKARGHEALGFDTDPLAVTIARAWCAETDPQTLLAKADEVLARAKSRLARPGATESYPRTADHETRRFLQYWFDPHARRQLNALADTIRRLREPSIRALMWCAFSRLIVTKKAGASLAMDVSHSRPHRVYDKAPLSAIDTFRHRVNSVARAMPFAGSGPSLPRASVQLGDARQLPLADESVDVVITSPPYLNAIDYVRAHKFSLVWMGYSIKQLRNLRTGNIGSEAPDTSILDHSYVRSALAQMGNTELLPERTRGVLARYILDMDLAISEIARVLRKNASATIVVGDSTVRGVFVANSKAITHIATKNGLRVKSTVKRTILDSRRYLPPPTRCGSGQMSRRMRQEVVISLAPS